MDLETIHLIRDRVRLFTEERELLTKREINRIFKAGRRYLGNDSHGNLRLQNIYRTNLISEKIIKSFLASIEERKSEEILWDGCGYGERLIEGISITWEEYKRLQLIAFEDEKVVKKYNKKLAKNKYHIYSWLDCDHYTSVELSVKTISEAEEEFRKYTEDIILIGGLFPWHS